MNFLTKSETARRVGYHPGHVMRLAKNPNHNFPAPLKLDSGRVIFLEPEIDAWQDAQIAERDDELARAGG